MKRTKAEQQMYQLCYATLAICLVLGGVTYYGFDEFSAGITSFATIQIGDDYETSPQEKSVEVTRELAIEKISQAKLDIAEMKENNFKTTYSQDLLAEANSALDRADYAELLRTGNFTNTLVREAKVALEGLDYAGFSYAGVLIYTEQISERKKQAYVISDSLSILEPKLGEYIELGVDTSEAETLLESTKTAFNEERYEDAEELIDQTNSELDAKRAEMTSVKALTQASKSFVERNWWQITITGILLIIFGSTIYTKYHILKTKKKVKHLKIERTTLNELMKKAQRERFESGTLSSSEYKIRMNKYKDKIMEIKRTLPVLNSILHKKKTKVKPSKAKALRGHAKRRLAWKPKQTKRRQRK
jgi:hypothetical protein